VTPVDIITSRLRTTAGIQHMGEGQIAEVAATALTDDRIINHAVDTVRSHDLDGGAVGHLSNAELMAVLRVAFNSVGA
jgi:hypothetical protein